MWLNVLLLLVGFTILIKASDIFVDAASSIAVNFKMPKMLIALTIAAFGTCAPELAISFNSVFSNNGDMALANVMGSSIVNILLIIGLASMIFPIKVKNETTKKQLPILLAITSFFSISLIGNIVNKENFIISRFDALILVIIFLAFIFYIISLARINRKISFRNKPKYKILKSIIYVIICIIAIIYSSDLVVNNAVKMAQYFNISQKVITMTIIVIGTSLPELITTIMASKKKEFDIAIGNIIGTNIFNIGIVLGLPILIKGNITSTSFNILDVLIVEFAAIILYVFAKNDKVLSRREGILMFSVFFIYYVTMIMS